MKDNLRSNDISSLIQINPIHKQLKEIYRTFSRNNQTSISIKTTIIWFKFNDNNDKIITNTQKLFENLVSSFLIFDDCEECYSHICMDGFNHSVFLIIDDNYQERSIATLQTLNNIKQFYRSNQSGVRFKLTYDLVSHYNQLGNQCEDNKDFENAKKKLFKSSRFVSNYS